MKDRQCTANKIKLLFQDDQVDHEASYVPLHPNLSSDDDDHIAFSEQGSSSNSSIELDPDSQQKKKKHKNRVLSFVFMLIPTKRINMNLKV